MESMNLFMSVGWPFFSNSSRYEWRSMPSGLTNILRVRLMPTTLIFNCNSSSRYCCCSLICFSRLPPTVPTPTTYKCNSLICDRKKSSCMAFNPFLRLSFLMTTDMFSSDEPCAVAITLIPFRASELNKVAEIPGVFFICSPTMATIDSSFSTRMLMLFPSPISWLNSFSMDFTALLVSAGETANVMEYSDDAWVIKITLIFLAAIAPNKRDEIPCTPTSPGPCKVIRSISSMDETPFMGASDSCTGMLDISVPSASGLKVLRMAMGISF